MKYGDVSSTSVKYLMSGFDLERPINNHKTKILNRHCHCMILIYSAKGDQRVRKTKYHRNLNWSVLQICNFERFSLRSNLQKRSSLDTNAMAVYFLIRNDKSQEQATIGPSTIFQIVEG